MKKLIGFVLATAGLLAFVGLLDSLPYLVRCLLLGWAFVASNRYSARRQRELMPLDDEYVANVDRLVKDVAAHTIAGMVVAEQHKEAPGHPNLATSEHREAVERAVYEAIRKQYDDSGRVVDWTREEDDERSDS